MVLVGGVDTGMNVRWENNKTFFDFPAHFIPEISKEEEKVGMTLSRLLHHDHHSKLVILLSDNYLPSATLIFPY